MNLSGRKRKLLLGIFLSISLLIFSSYLAFRSAYVQTFLVQSIASDLNDNMPEKISLEGVDFELFSKLVLEEVLILDYKGDTLFALEKLKLDFDKFSIFNNHYEVSEINLINANVNIVTQEGDSISNLEYFLSHIQSNNDDNSSEELVIFSPKDIHFKNTSFKLKDEALSYDQRISEGYVKFSVFDPDRLIFKIDELLINGSQARIVSSSAENKEEGFIIPFLSKGDLSLENIQLINSKWEYNGDYLELDIALDYLGLGIDTIKLQGDKIALHKADIGKFVLEDLLFTCDSNGIFIGGTLAGENNGLKFYDNISWNHNKTPFVKARHSGKLVGNLSLEYLSKHFPELKKWYSSIAIDAGFKGTLMDMGLTRFKVSSEDGSFFHADAELQTSLISTSDLFMQIDIDSIHISNGDIVFIDSNITTPFQLSAIGQLGAKGKLIGYPHDLLSYLDINSALGQVQSDVKLSSSDEFLGFKGQISLKEFGLGAILGISEIGNTNLSLQLNGSQQQSDLNVELEFMGNFIEYNNERIDNIYAKGNIKDDVFEGDINIKDDAVDLNFNGQANISGERYLFNFLSIVNHLDLKKLGLSKEDIVTSAFVNMDFSATSIDDVIGTANLNNLEFRNKDSLFVIEELEFISDIYSGYRYLGLYSDVADFGAEGDFYWYEIPDIFRKYFNKRYPLFFKVPEKEINSKFWDISLNVKALNPLMEVLNIPLKIEEKASLESHWKKDLDSISISANIPQVQYQNFSLRGLDANVEMLRDEVKVDASIARVDMSAEMGVDEFNLRIDQNGELMNFYMDVDAQDSINYFSINGKTYWKEDRGIVDIENLFLEMSGDHWQWNGGNINFDLEGIYVEPQSIRLRNQNISMAGRLTKDRRDVFKIMFGHINANDIYTSLDGPEGMLKGDLNGVFFLRSILDEPEILWKGKIDELYVHGHRYGDFDINIRNEGHQEELKMKINGDPKYTDLLLEGVINTQGEVDVSFALKNFDCQKIAPLIEEHFAKLKGKTTLKLDVKGALIKPDVNGQVVFDNVNGHVNYLGVDISIDDQLTFNESSFKLHDFDVFDERGNKALINGAIRHNYFNNWSFDSLQLIPQGSFFALNTSFDDNELYFGQGLLQKEIKSLDEVSGLLINGSLNAPQIDMKISANEESHITIPIEEEEDFTSQSFVRFKQEEEEEAFSPDIEEEELKLTFNADLELLDKAELEIQLGVPDGDIIKVFGEGNLQLDYNDKGEFNLFGQYKVEEGHYIFNFQDIIKKKFNIIEGSQLSWIGNPYAGQLDLRTSYRIRTNIAPLLREASYAQEVNIVRSTVYVIMEMRGELLSPEISFNIQIDEPQYASLVDPVLKRIQADDQELNKQVFTLLLINRFAPLFNKTTTTARSNALYSNLSEYVSGQLQELVSSSGSEFLSTMDLGVELASYEHQDQQAQDAQNQRELKLALSKKLFKDRLIIDVGTNVYFAEQQENHLAGDFSIEYLVTKDGRVRVKLFNESLNQDIIQEKNRYKRGVSLSYKREYDNLKEFFSQRN